MRPTNNLYWNWTQTWHICITMASGYDDNIFASWRDSCNDRGKTTIGSSQKEMVATDLEHPMDLFEQFHHKKEWFNHIYIIYYIICKRYYYMRLQHIRRTKRSLVYFYRHDGRHGKHNQRLPSQWSNPPVVQKHNLSAWSLSVCLSSHLSIYLICPAGLALSLMNSHKKQKKPLIY